MSAELIDGKFTPARMRDFKAFRGVQNKGKYNVLDPRARILMGIEVDDFVFILDNYDAMEAQFLLEEAQKA